MGALPPQARLNPAARAIQAAALFHADPVVPCPLPAARLGSVRGDEGARGRRRSAVEPPNSPKVCVCKVEASLLPPAAHLPPPSHPGPGAAPGTHRAALCKIASLLLVPVRGVKGNGNGACERRALFHARAGLAAHARPGSQLAPGGAGRTRWPGFTGPALGPCRQARATPGQDACTRMPPRPAHFVSAEAANPRSAAARSCSTAPRVTDSASYTFARCKISVTSQHLRLLSGLWAQRWGQGVVHGDGGKGVRAKEWRAGCTGRPLSSTAEAGRLRPFSTKKETKHGLHAANRIKHTPQDTT